MAVANSIMQSKKECFITKATTNLHKHHIFKGPLRKAAEKYGCWIWLRYDWHNGASYGVHFNSQLDRQLKQLCQMEFEKIHGHEKYMAVFGKNYLEE